MTAQQEKFKPSEHFRNLKGQQYLEVKWRVVWFREEHADGYIKTEMVEHDPVGGLAVFKAQAGFFQRIAFEDGHDAYPPATEVYATGYGSETRKDFTDYLEKSETKAVGRALAMLGYGTAQAIELDEEIETTGVVADSPVERKAAPQRQQAQQVRPGKPAPASTTAAVDTELALLRAERKRLVEKYPDAAAALQVADKNLPDTVARLQCRERLEDPASWVTEANGLLERYGAEVAPAQPAEIERMRAVIEAGRRLLPDVVPVAAKDMAVNTLVEYLEHLYDAAQETYPVLFDDLPL